MPFGWAAAAVSVGTSIYSGISQNDNAQAAVSQQDAFGPYRSGLAGLVNSLIRDPSQAQNFPGFQFGAQQGTQAVEGSNAARGMLNSGNTLSGISSFNQNYAQQNWMNDIQGISNIIQGNPNYSQQSLTGANAQTQGITQGLGGLSSLFSFL